MNDDKCRSQSHRFRKNPSLNRAWSPDPRRETARLFYWCLYCVALGASLSKRSIENTGRHRKGNHNSYHKSYDSFSAHVLVWSHEVMLLRSIFLYYFEWLICIPFYVARWVLASNKAPVQLRRSEPAHFPKLKKPEEPVALYLWLETILILCGLKLVNDRVLAARPALKNRTDMCTWWIHDGISWSSKPWHEHGLDMATHNHNLDPYENSWADYNRLHDVSWCKIYPRLDFLYVLRGLGSRIKLKKLAVL